MFGLLFHSGYRIFAERALESRKEDSVGEMLRHWKRELAGALQKDWQAAPSPQTARAKVGTAGVLEELIMNPDYKIIVAQWEMMGGHRYLIGLRTVWWAEGLERTGAAEESARQEI